MLQISEKIKPMTKEELTLSIDRLTRFKPPEEKYNRVFREIIAKYLITPKIGFKEYEKLSEEEIVEFVEEIINVSLLQFEIKEKNTIQLYKSIINLENELYNINSSTKKLMQAKIPYENILNLNKTQKETLPKNLKSLYHQLTSNLSPDEIRKKFKTTFPIKKVVLAEGITEEILLPKFAQILKFNFDENGVIVIPAGGKNQVAKEYLKLRENLKIPVVILLDADATEIAQKISNKLRESDRLILIEKGEFEDILPLSLLKKAINYKFVNIFKIDEKDFSSTLSRVKDLEEIYRINGLGEFKKADFAQNINTVLNETSTNYISSEIKNIVNEIKET